MNLPEIQASPLSSEHVRFLSERFQRFAGQEAAPGHLGRYAVVRQGHETRGLVAVDGKLGIWYTPRAEDRTELCRMGFAHSRGNVLASLYFDAPGRAA
jgi:hypothetical protein